MKDSLKLLTSSNREAVTVRVAAIVDVAAL